MAYLLWEVGRGIIIGSIRLALDATSLRNFLEECRLQTYNGAIRELISHPTDHRASYLTTVRDESTNLNDYIAHNFRYSRRVYEITPNTLNTIPRKLKMQEIRDIVNTVPPVSSAPPQIVQTQEDWDQ